MLHEYDQRNTGNNQHGKTDNNFQPYAFVTQNNHIGHFDQIIAGRSDQRSTYNRFKGNIYGCVLIKIQNVRINIGNPYNER